MGGSGVTLIDSAFSVRAGRSLGSGRPGGSGRSDRSLRPGRARRTVHSIGSGGHGCHAHRSDQADAAGAVGRIDDDRQMTQLLDGRHCTQIQRVTGIGFKCADAAFAENYIWIALA